MQKEKSLEIENECLRVTYERVGNTVSLTEKGTGLTFVKDCRIEGECGDAMTSSAQDPIFGTGRKIVIQQSDGMLRFTLTSTISRKLKWKAKFRINR